MVESSPLPGSLQKQFSPGASEQRRDGRGSRGGGLAALQVTEQRQHRNRGQESSGQVVIIVSPHSCIWFGRAFLRTL